MRSKSSPACRFPFVRRAAFAAGARLTLALRILNSLRREIRIGRLFILHRMIRLLRAGAALLGALIYDLVRVELSIRLLLVLHRTLGPMIGAARGRGFVV